MPGFINKSIGIITRIGHGKAEIPASGRQPHKGIRFLEFFGQRPTAGGRDVDGSAGVMLAESRRGVDLQNLRYLKPDLQFVPDQLSLIFETPESGHDEETHTIATCRFRHLLPLHSSCRRELLHAPDEIRSNLHEISGFLVIRQLAVPTIVRRYA